MAATPDVSAYFKVAKVLKLSPVSDEMRNFYKHRITYGAFLFDLMAEEKERDERDSVIMETMALWFHAPEVFKKHLQSKSNKLKADKEELKYRMGEAKDRVPVEKLDEFLDDEDKIEKERLALYPNAVNIDLMKCYGCGRCVKVCPKGAIEMNGDTSQAVVLRKLCDGCSICIKACYTKAIYVGSTEVKNK